MNYLIPILSICLIFLLNTISFCSVCRNSAHFGQIAQLNGACRTAAGKIDR
jgi:hypothetical protein